jgi:inosine-uridine nucleoside N-ribohydrolase
MALSMQTPANAATAPGPPPLRVIFDTDIWSDIDDAMALAMLHAFVDRHEVKLLAVTISTDDPWCASYVDLINTFYGHADTPIGIVHDGILHDPAKKLPPGTSIPTRYTEVISQRRNSDGTFTYPHRLTDWTKVPEAVALLRKTLAAQPDGSVVIIQTGYSTNLARLLDSQADGYSSLNGRALVKRKVRLLSVMAGSFRDAQFRGQLLRKGAPETNLVVDVPAAQKVFSRWPTPIVDSGGEVGLAMPYPGRSIVEDYSYVEHHPIADTYLMYCEEQKAKGNSIAGFTPQTRCPHDHGTYDLTAVLYAVRSDRGYFSLSKPGRITVLPDGGSRFDESDAGQHRYLILGDEQKERALEAMVMLTSQPPRQLVRVAVSRL